MPTRLVHVVADAQDPARLARFWAALLGWEIADETGEEVDVWPAGYTYPDPVAVPIVFVPVPERKTGKNRVHLDLASASAADQAELAGRARDLGGGPADVGQGDVPWVVMADPEGNEFCVLEPRDEYRDTGPVAAIPSAALRAARLQIVGSGQGSVPTRDILAELPGLAAEITSGSFRIDARPVPLADVETAWKDTGSDQRIVITP